MTAGLPRPGRAALVAGLLGGAATSAGIALTATSGWLVVRASERPVILTLLAAIVAVRAFGMARPFFRYLERVHSHDAALADLARRRTEVYAALVPLTLEPTMLERLAICQAQYAVPDIEAAMNKAWGASIGDEFAQLALDLMGPFGGLWGGEHSAFGGKLADEYLMAGHARVAAGGVDTSKSIIARRLLGLPNALGKPELPGR